MSVCVTCVRVCVCVSVCVHACIVWVNSEADGVCDRSYRSYLAIYWPVFRSRDRLFAGFLLHNIGTSADVEIDVCVATGDGGRSCDHPAGKFSLLGGDTEMPFAFDRLYK